VLLECIDEDAHVLLQKWSKLRVPHYQRMSGVSHVRMGNPMYCRIELVILGTSRWIQMREMMADARYHLSTRTQRPSRSSQLPTYKLIVSSIDRSPTPASHDHTNRLDLLRFRFSGRLRRLLHRYRSDKPSRDLGSRRQPGREIQHGRHGEHRSAREDCAGR
jgi:hypothetical protein